MRTRPGGAGQNRREFLKDGIKATVLASLSLSSLSSAEASSHCPAKAYGTGAYGAGCFAGGKVRLTTFPQSVAAILQEGFKLFISGPPGRQVVIERSSDLRAWNPLQTQRISTASAPVSVVDENSAGSSPLFYRAQIP